MSHTNESTPLLIDHQRDDEEVFRPAVQRSKSRCFRVCLGIWLMLTITFGVGGYLIYKLIPPMVQYQIDHSPPPVVDKLSVIGVTNQGIRVHMKGHLFYPVPSYLSVVGFNARIAASVWNVTAETWPNGTEYGGSIAYVDMPDIFVLPGDQTILDLNLLLRDVNTDYFRQISARQTNTSNLTVTAQTDADLSMFSGRLFWNTIHLYSRQVIVLKEDKMTELPESPESPPKEPEQPETDKSLFDKLNLTIVDHEENLYRWELHLILGFDNPVPVEILNPGKLSLDAHYKGKQVATADIYRLFMNYGERNRSSVKVDVFGKTDNHGMNWARLVYDFKKGERLRVRVTNFTFSGLIQNEDVAVDWVNRILEPIDAEFEIPEL